jgi:predicted component of type VI protein secretion system
LIHESAWNIIQHSTKIVDYLPLIKNAAEHKELPFHLYAMMFDRDLSNKNKEQVYGTQAACSVLVNTEKAGFDLTVEQHAKRLGLMIGLSNCLK